MPCVLSFRTLECNQESVGCWREIGPVLATCHIRHPLHSPCIALLLPVSELLLATAEVWVSRVRRILTLQIGTYIKRCCSLTENGKKPMIIIPESLPSAPSLLPHPPPHLSLPPGRPSNNCGASARVLAEFWGAGGGGRGVGGG